MNKNIQPLDLLLKVLAWPFRVISENAVFFLFIFLLGYIGTQIEVATHYRGAKPYIWSAEELFFDLWLLCAVLTLVPRRVRRWLKLAVAVVLYAVAIADMFCYVRFDSTLTPTMLMLAFETDGREASEFLSSYVGWDIVTTSVGWLLLLIPLHIAGSWLARRYASRWTFNERILRWLRPLMGVLTAALFIYCYSVCQPNKQAMVRLFSYNTIGGVEHDLTRRDCATLYLPVYRLAFSLYSNRLAARQLDQLAAAMSRAQVDSCSFRSSNIVLIIGESYNRHRSQLYGYDMETTPRQLQRAKDGSLVVFSDVVAPWNLTSYAFKHCLSVHALGDSATWCDAPLFPLLFRRAGYRVTFLTNQFLPKAGERVYDFSGGFFLNNREVSRELFDLRNGALHPYDEGLLDDYDALLKAHRLAGTDSTLQHNLILFHLMGQHVNYNERFPRDRKKYTPKNYSRPDLTLKQRWRVADYDNALAYNDSVVDVIMQRFEHEDAIVIYMPDHGEECFNPGSKMFGRLHSARIDRRLAREEFEIPFWVWCSPLYRERHPDVVAALQEARERPFMTDNVPHLLLSLAGIHCPYYRPDYDLLSPAFNAKRPRRLKNQVDYNQLIRNEKR